MNSSLTKTLNEITKKSKEGNYEQALDMCETTLRKYPDSYEVYETQSEVFYRMGNYDNALSSLEYVIELMPNEAAPLFRRGRWKLKLGNYREAIDDMSKVIELNLEYFQDAAYYYRAESYLYCHDFQNVLIDCNHIPDDFYLGPNKITKAELISQAQKGISGL